MSNDLFLRACRLEETERTPIWLMRQAGRYMQEYQAIRRKHTFLEMCRTPRIAAEVTLQPIKVFDLDAAILFSDILIPLEAMGVDLDFIDGEGPKLDVSLESMEDIKALKIPDPHAELGFVLEAIKILRKSLNVPLIGFSGAPFTLASYILEGGGSKSYLKTKSMMYNEPAMWKELMKRLSTTIVLYLNAQIEAGAQAIQIFDSWVGCLSPGDYKRFVQPYMIELMGSIKGDAPIIQFGTNTASLLELMSETGGDVIGVDWRINLDEAWRLIGLDKGIQGNLDPAVLFSKSDVIKREVKDILGRANGRPGHIFNLGHGILPTTPVEGVRVIIDAVRKLSAR